MNVLIVYYSRTGITAEIARAIHKEMGGDLEEIQDTRNRSGILGYLRSGLEAALKKQATIKEARNDPGEYDLVLIGTPVWSNNMSTPVRAYLERYKTSFKAAAYFATCGSTGVSKVLRDMENLGDTKARALLEINKAGMKSGGSGEKVKLFVREVLHIS